MIVLGAVLPHPPILLPQIAQGREAHVQATLHAYETVAVRLRELDVQRLLLISTHGIVTLNRFHTLGADLSGNFERFGHPGLTFEHPIDQEIAQRLVAAAESADLPLTRTTIWEQSDHSVGVPITLLGDALPPAIGVVSTSFRSPADHYRLGQTIGHALSELSEPTAIIASGDAVHRLNDDSPRGAHPQGEEVQQTYETALSNWDHETLITLDESLRREVDESVISPTLILMGALQELDPIPRILCSEHPWGVGYVTALVDTTPGTH
ncbi:MAG: class III extradiol dioxygenase subunit B-like domain-containing protein [Chloroflexota bacterium]|nr:class III extradiol dioxygenase subunit B-like domain-containing protein [Chloroflexota bacterium]MDE2895753.1 class III extradiol dioxygenase subunit B-like domain-containing protein [Chloroflexota bacterium]